MKIRPVGTEDGRT